MDTDEAPSEAKRMTEPSPSASAYLDPNYWNERFSKEEHYEWFKEYSHFHHLIQAHIKPDSSWRPVESRASTVSNVMAMLENIHRVLKLHGSFISITFGQPHFRRPLFHNPKLTWSLEWSTFGDGFHYFFHILRKGRRTLDDKDSSEKLETPSICLLQEELKDEDYLFRTKLDEMN